MNIDEFRHLDAVAIDELVAASEVSTSELHGAATAVHEQTHEHINAILEWYPDPAPATPVSGPEPALRGVPMLRKDYGSAEQGRLVEMGSRLALGNRATETAPFVQRLTTAGVQIVGRSAVPEFIQHGVTESRVHGTTHNPWDLSVSAGGSSGGAGAAVASGVVPIAHASDCAGSIRIPASTCGLVGLKPGRQRVSWATDWDGIAQEFVLCRTVRDARRCLDVLGDGDYAPIAERARIAVSTSNWAGVTTDPGVVAAAEQAAALLESLGHQLDEIADPVDYESMMDTWATAFSRFALEDAQRMSERTGRAMNDTTLEPMTLAAIDRFTSLTPDERTKSINSRQSTVQQLTTSMADYDVILTPTLGRATIPIDTLGGEADPNAYSGVNDEIFPYNYLFNLSGWPSISVPGKPDQAGHPIGVQLSARIGHEHTLLALAHQIETAEPWPLLAPLPA